MASDKKNAMTQLTRKVILDKGFLQAEKRESPLLHALSNAGAQFVLTDTLIYEICSGSRPNEWTVAQRKLFPFHDKVEIWLHASELLEFEIRQQSPIKSPVSEELTDRVRNWFRSGLEYAPSTLRALAQHEFSRREGGTADNVFKFCQAFAQISPEYSKRCRIASKNNVNVLAADLVSRQELVQTVARWCHGEPSNPDTFIKEAQNGLTCEWFAFHHARSAIAVALIYIRHFTTLTVPSEDFRHTVVDADYITLMHYADALATNETSGHMSSLTKWLLDSSKTIFSTGSLAKIIPTEEETRTVAHKVWESSGGTHGHAFDDWLLAKTRTFDELWARLQRSREP
ncbi:MAG: hypothetical protein JWM16_2311 [Verrucomicrobiales bacterium]|nr:hypothetical protein [Verrucomicrobiales bacterium]